ncbi:ATP-binding cassette domain-containing protein [Streptomyces aurantiacus]|uniref:Putative Daunorubicin/doxorubicin resistance ATP-binding protein DrrA n=1 Tax=Streptomyces aurantiacus JA 4570 TaxID=1286094 RepID=S4ARC5_9ACTN|nr:ATP-binding cassette domain-containing protein [Streptomyces aurantiacus]EPH43987.1 putative Daunorubicin/doxorubicin resistance ATP-binding protein DrrA [Streptomyces aurantiacus JA 4570]
MTALAGIDLDVAAGTVLGLLGPNGAGKTTAVRVLSTLLRPSGGRAEVAGFDVARQPALVRSRIGLAGQYAAVDELLTGRENLVMFGRLLHLSRRGARRRADELLRRFELTGAADRPAGTYSGGMRRRLDLASCLIGSPQVLFLDEPTVGLDPASRIVLWNTVRGLVQDGMTVLLTTQYLDEADWLADDIVVIESGRIIAAGTPEELKRKVGEDRLEVQLVASARAEEAAGAADLAVSVLTAIAQAPPTVDKETGRVSVQLTDGAQGVGAAAIALREAGVDVADFVLRRPTLDDVFLNLVGRSADNG